MRYYITGEIDDVAFRRFHKFIRKAEKEAYTCEEIVSEHGNVEIILTSHGGDATAALAMFDTIALSKLKFTVIGTGLIASAAVILLAAGDKSYLTPSAWVMVHEEQLDEESSKDVSTMEHTAKTYRRFESQWNAILAQNSSTSAEKWAELNKRDTYLSAKECLELGLIDEILS